MSKPPRVGFQKRNDTFSNSTELTNDKKQALINKTGMKTFFDKKKTNVGEFHLLNVDLIIMMEPLKILNEVIRIEHAKMQELFSELQKVSVDSKFVPEADFETVLHSVLGADLCEKHNLANMLFRACKGATENRKKLSLAKMKALVDMNCYYPVLKRG